MHYIQPGVKNQYQEAIEAVAPIGERYLDSRVACVVQESEGACKEQLTSRK